MGVVPNGRRPERRGPQWRGPEWRSTNFDQQFQISSDHNLHDNLPPNSSQNSL
jgi:hypothetical protein